jgi:hypothetical protein
MNPLRSGFYSVQLISHKVMRYLVPVFLLLVLAMSLALAPHSGFYTVTAVAQILFYVAAVTGWVLERSGRHSHLLALPQYFFLANLAAVIAFYKFARGERYARWEPVRESASQLHTQALTHPDEM